MEISSFFIQLRVENCEMNFNELVWGNFGFGFFFCSRWKLVFLLEN
jgi:hypothetical protein